MVKIDCLSSKNITLLILSRLAKKEWIIELSRGLIGQFYT